jgi:hypothetical protein
MTPCDDVVRYNIAAWLEYVRYVPLKFHCINVPYFGLPYKESCFFLRQKCCESFCAPFF